MSFGSTQEERMRNSDSLKKKTFATVQKALKKAFPKHTFKKIAHSLVMTRSPGKKHDYSKDFEWKANHSEYGRQFKGLRLAAEDLFRYQKAISANYPLKKDGTINTDKMIAKIEAVLLSDIEQRKFQAEANGHKAAQLAKLLDVLSTAELEITQPYDGTHLHVRISKDFRPARISLVDGNENVKIDYGYRAEHTVKVENAVKGLVLITSFQEAMKDL
jgi:hypothetical protein